MKSLVTKLPVKSDWVSKIPVEIEHVEYTAFEVSPSRMTSNAQVRWLLVELARLYTPLSKRVKFEGFKVKISPEHTIWWEVFINKNSIKFYLIVPDIESVKDPIKRQIMKTWKQANVREVKHSYNFSQKNTEIVRLGLKHNSILSLGTQNPHYSPLDSILNAKHYLQGKDEALLQIGLKPLGNGWNRNAQTTNELIRKSRVVPRKQVMLTKREIIHRISYFAVWLLEEATNFLGYVLMPSWNMDNTATESMRNQYDLDPDSIHTRQKIRHDAFLTEIRVLSKSEDEERRESIIRSISSGFDPLEGDNKLKEVELTSKHKQKVLEGVNDRKMTVKINGDVLCTLELAKMINVPDRKAQIEHYNELSIVSHRGDSDIPKDIFVDDGEGVPFCLYEDNDGEMKTGYFAGKDKNLLCMARVVIGEPGTGKTTFAQNFALDVFNRGYGAFVIDAADGKMAQRILDRVSPDKRDKVKIIDFMNTDYPIGLGWNEIFRVGNQDIIEDLIVEETLDYIHLISGTELNMRSKQWVENAIKAVFINPDATLLDIENMLNNSDYRGRIIKGITDPELKRDWEYFHNMMGSEQRRTIYEEAFRRLAPVMRKRTLRNFILQKPKKDKEGNYLFDIRKWMDEGYLVLVKANETLGETLQTALVSFVLSKFNLAMISREDIVLEDDRKPCFLLLDEPDHYIKSSEKWRNMLTRYRKYRCGLVFMFHGWQMLKEMDKDLPKIIRKAGPHYVIFQTDEDNLKDLRPVIEPEFKVSDIAKGIPQFHAVIRLKMYSKDGGVVPAFMAKGIGKTESRFGDKWIESKGEYSPYNNDDLYQICAKELGRPKDEVMNDIFNVKKNSEFNTMDLDNILVNTEGSGDLEIVEEEEEDLEELQRTMEQELSRFYELQKDVGEELDEDLLIHMDEILQGETNE